MRRTWLPILALTVTIPSMAAAKDFEGAMTSRTVTVKPHRLAVLLKGESTDASKVFALPTDRLLSLAQDPDSGVEVKATTVLVSGSKVHVAVGTDNYVITDVTQNTFWLVLPAQKTYAEWHRPDPNVSGGAADAAQKSNPGTASALPTPSVRALGKTQTINGMQASAYEVHAGDATTIAWMTQTQPELASTFKAFQQQQQKVVEAGTHAQVVTLLGGYGLPVRTQTIDRDGYRLEELTQIERKSLPANLFTLPAGFTKENPPPTGPPVGQPPQ